MPHNLSNKFQLLDINVNQSGRKFVSKIFDSCYLDRVSRQLSTGIAHGYVKVFIKLLNC